MKERYELSIDPIEIPEEDIDIEALKALMKE